MTRRIARAVWWAALAGGGLTIGLLVGARVADIPPDGRMLVQLGCGAALLALLIGLVLPRRATGARTGPARTGPARGAATPANAVVVDVDDVIDVTDATDVIDLTRPAGERTPPPARRRGTGRDPGRPTRRAE